MAHIGNQCTLVSSTRASESFSTHHSRHLPQTDQSWRICHPGPETWAHRDRVPSWPFLLYKHPARYATLNWWSSKQSWGPEHELRWAGQTWYLPHRLHVALCCRSLVPTHFVFVSFPFVFFSLALLPWLLASRAGSTQNLPFISTNKMEVVFTHYPQNKIFYFSFADENDLRMENPLRLAV